MIAELIQSGRIVGHVVSIVPSETEHTLSYRPAEDCTVKRLKSISFRTTFNLKDRPTEGESALMRTVCVASSLPVPSRIPGVMQVDIQQQVKDGKKRAEKSQ